MGALALAFVKGNQRRAIGAAVLCAIPKAGQASRVAGLEMRI